ncbi:SCP2 sterol-binding domain-containing protein [Actinokineospora sp. NBRC 105648]|uniref:SCP2 sterol-binding domain-containing protein n=1 Tax=Actinokineospora sp. NBRC 105648 TaxID=3032206 RepID=UPI00249FF412|nr:SCP2 sterol-binding domain-containing protein [Actinokineospora sp. NBRC 105648]GLZ37483.1 sterol-binding protein [Actinokineospora sp. NBRC 105648]
MSDPGRAGADIGALEPRELVALLDRMDPADIAAMDIDVDAIGRAVDPRQLGRDDLSLLLGAINRLAEAGAGVDLSGLAPPTFARIIAHASREQVEAIMGQPRLRAAVLTEIFRRMGSHLREDRVVGLHAVIHWRLTGGTGEGGYDRYEAVIAEGACVVGREMAQRPRVTITLSPVDFCKLVTHNASAPVLFMTGKLKVRGDLAFAAGLTGLFELPHP